MRRRKSAPPVPRAGMHKRKDDVTRIAARKKIRSTLARAPKASVSASAYSEEFLSRLEPSWADFAAGLRTGNRYRRRRGSLTFLGRNMTQVEESLKAHKNSFEAGDKLALLWALRSCC